MASTSESVYLIVNEQTAWPIFDRRLAELYRENLYAWPGCRVAMSLHEAEWEPVLVGDWIKYKRRCLCR
ncbi:MAG: hypothetical protein WC551_09775 [Patescibacteria group bacterium]